MRGKTMPKGSGIFKSTLEDERAEDVSRKGRNGRKEGNEVATVLRASGNPWLSREWMAANS